MECCPVTLLRLQLISGEDPNMASSTTDFARPASEAALDALAERLRERNFEVVIVETAAEAKSAVLERLPEGAEIHSGKSNTLEDIGVFGELMEGDTYDFIRNRRMQMDRKTQMRSAQKLAEPPAYIPRPLHP